MLVEEPRDPAVLDGAAYSPRLGEVADDQAAQVIELERQVAELQRQVADLQRGLVARQQVGIAVGLLAHRCAIDADRSWLLLRRLSQHLNVKAHDIAAAVVLSHDRECGAGVPPADEALAAAVEGMVAAHTVRAVLLSPRTGTA